MFGKNNKHVSYGYAHVDYENDFFIKFNSKHKAEYKVKIYYENIKREKEELIMILRKSEWEDRCKDKNRICYIQIDITLNEIKNEENPVLEFSIKSISSNYVSYITKNILKIDYVQNNDPQYYYTELVENEKGFIIVNFIRGDGKVLCKNS